MKRLRLVFVLALLAAVGALAGDRPATARAADDSTIKVAVFDVDATPPVGSAMAYDPVKREVVGDAEATALLRRPYRAPWVHPEPDNV